MKTAEIQSPTQSSCQRGMSLIEVMIALVIAALLTIGLIQIFGASRATYQTQEGLSRVQESGRFANQYLQRNLRMAGFMGCGSDVGRFNAGSFVNHLAMFDQSIPSSKNEYRFQRPIEAFTAGSMTAPAEFSTIALTEDSDVLILRILSEEGVPLISVNKAGDGVNLTLMTDVSQSIFGGDSSDGIYAMQNCRSADVFAARIVGADMSVRGLTSPNVYKDPSVTCTGSGDGCPWDFRISNATLNAKPLIGGARVNTEIHRAEYVALFVRNNPNNIPSLYVRRFERNGVDLGAAQELVEGVENMQLRFGVDLNGDGAVNEYRTPAQMVAGVTGDLALDAQWRQVLSVRVGMLIRSPDPASVSSGSAADPRTFELLGVTLTPPNDRAMRQIYETTVALRNRIYNS